jgi:predicted phosphodiesterase
VAVFGDIHGNLPALEAVLADIAARGADALVCLGDLAFKGPAPSECVALIRERGIPCVLGNTDFALARRAAGVAEPLPLSYSDDPAIWPYVDWHVDRLDRADLAYLETLTRQFRLTVGEETALFVHATPDSLCDDIRPGQDPATVAAKLAGAEATCVVAGHTHDPFVFRADGRLLVNAGGVGQSLDGDGRAAYVVLETEGRFGGRLGSVEIRRVSYDIERTVRQARERGFCFSPEWYGTALRKGSWDFIPWSRRGAIDAFRR